MSKRILITAGPTIEDIDPVRFISNRSSGRMGVAAAAAALRAGHFVTLVHGPLTDEVLQELPQSARLKIIGVRSASEMYRAVKSAARSTDLVIMTAAVADYTPAAPARAKLKKAGGMILKLKPTVDILNELGKLKRRRKGLCLIGFALESGTGSTPAARRKSQLAEARRKLAQKNLDAIVLDSPAEMGTTHGDFTLISRDGRERVMKNSSKSALANVLIQTFATAAI